MVTPLALGAPGLTLKSVPTILNYQKKCTFAKRSFVYRAQGKLFRIAHEEFLRIHR